MSLFAKFPKLIIPSAVSFSKMQRVYLLPSIEDMWESEQEKTFQEFADKYIVVLGRCLDFFLKLYTNTIRRQITLISI
jgi:hypothetical protein